MKCKVEAIAEGSDAQEPRPLPLAGHILCEPGMWTFWRGRVALYAILKSLGVGPGDSILVPGYTCFAVPSAVLFAGAQPIYADIDPETFNISPTTIEASLRNFPRAHIKAIIVQHTYGIPADLHRIMSWAQERGIAVIEDCAHVLGGCYRIERGKWCKVGSVGDAAFFSSQWTKPVSTGLGGWAKVNNPKLEFRLRRFYEEECVGPAVSEVIVLAAQVLVREIFRSSMAYWMAVTAYRWLYRRGLLIGTSTRDELRANMPPAYAKRMSSFQLWLLKRHLADTAAQEHRRHMKAIYDAVLGSAGLPTLKVPDYADAILLRYPVRVRNKQRAMKEARRRRIELGDWYSNPVDRPESLKGENFGYQTGTCPEGERAAKEVVNLPMHPGVTQQIAHRAVEFLVGIS